MMAALKLPTGTHRRNYAPGRAHVAKPGSIKSYGAVLVCIVLIQVPLMLSFMGGSFSPAYAFDDQQVLTQRVTGFSGEDAQEIQSALDNLEQKKNVRFWVYRTDQLFAFDPHSGSTSKPNFSAEADLLTTNFTDKDSLLMLYTNGLKNNGKCDEITCQTITYYHRLYPNVSEYLTETLGKKTSDLLYSGKPKQAVVYFLNALANSSAEPATYQDNSQHPRSLWKTLLLVLFIVFIMVAGAMVRVVGEGFILPGLKWSIRERKYGRRLAREQVNDPEKLAQNSVLALYTYSKKLLKSVAKRIDAYGLAVRQADDELGSANIPQFHQAHDQAKEALQKAYHIRQLLDEYPVNENRILRLSYFFTMKTGVIKSFDFRSDMLIELITTLHTANNNLAKNANNLNAMREEFFKAPELTQKLVQKSIDLEGRIPAATTTLDTLKKSYSTDILSPVLNNIEAARNELDIAKRALGSGQTNLEKGNPRALDYIHTADTALQKITKLLDDIDSFEANTHTTINQ